MRNVTADRAGRADAVLAAGCPDISRARLQRLIAGGDVTRNGQPVRKAEQVEVGDILAFEVPETAHPQVDPGVELPVLYEDPYLAAIAKPAGIAVHGAPGDLGPSVANWWLARLGPAASAFDVERPGIVHRLDKDTSGVLLLAKTTAAQGALSAAFENRSAKKTYLAICDGQLPREHAIVDSPIGRHPGDRSRMALVKRGREARTEYEVLASTRDLVFVLVRPTTGRTHQIRVHLAAVGAPVRFDRVYGAAGRGRQQLHAWRIAIPHPAGGLLTVTSALPSDMAAESRRVADEDVVAPFLLDSAPVVEPES